MMRTISGHSRVDGEDESGVARFFRPLDAACRDCLSADQVELEPAGPVRRRFDFF